LSWSVPTTTVAASPALLPRSSSPHWLPAADQDCDIAVCLSVVQDGCSRRRPPVVPAYCPARVQLQPGRTYRWCACGRSKKQPWYAPGAHSARQASSRCCLHRLADASSSLFCTVSGVTTATQPAILVLWCSVWLSSSLCTTSASASTAASRPSVTALTTTSFVDTRRTRTRASCRTARRQRRSDQFQCEALDEQQQQQ
jgi:hypothetical protein